VEGWKQDGIHFRRHVNYSWSVLKICGTEWVTGLPQWLWTLKMECPEGLHVIKTADFNFWLDLLREPGCRRWTISLVNLGWRRGGKSKRERTGWGQQGRGWCSSVFCYAKQPVSCAQKCIWSPHFCNDKNAIITDLRISLWRRHIVYTGGSLSMAYTGLL